MRIYKVRKNGKVFDYILPHEEARLWEVVTVESVEVILAELCYNLIIRKKVRVVVFTTD